jgi:hypothetical protein
MRLAQKHRNHRSILGLMRGPCSPTDRIPFDGVSIHRTEELTAFFESVDRLMGLCRLEGPEGKRVHAHMAQNVKSLKDLFRRQLGQRRVDTQDVELVNGTLRLMETDGTEVLVRRQLHLNNLDYLRRILGILGEALCVAVNDYCAKNNLPPPKGFQNKPLDPKVRRGAGDGGG